MFPLYRLGTFLEDVSTDELHIDRFELYYLLVNFLRHLDNVWHRFLLANDKKQLFTIITSTFFTLFVAFFICIAKTTYILL